MITKYFKGLEQVLDKIETTDINGRPISSALAVNRVIKSILRVRQRHNKLMFIGNGGSASIASHMATDFLKNAKIPALAFNDSSLITCISNDLGYEQVFGKPIDILANKNDILFAISSSGKSRNILNGVDMARNKGCLTITLSGFDNDNPLRSLGNINFYLPSYSYGFVEIGHLAVCHYFIDTIMKKYGG